MTKRLRLTLVASISAILLASADTALSQASQTSAQTPQPFKTIWTGVYTKVQATRGGQAYTQACSRCHRDDLRGGDKGPSLTGPPFFDRWHDLKLRDVFAYIQSAMPHDHEVFVSADSARDILSFLLEKNEVPAGNEELSTDIDKLGQILITRPPK